MGALLGIVGLGLAGLLGLILAATMVPEEVPEELPPVAPPEEEEELRKSSTPSTGRAMFSGQDLPNGNEYMISG